MCLFAATLSHAGFEVDEAETGAAGLALALSGPDLSLSATSICPICSATMYAGGKVEPGDRQHIPVLQISRLIRFG